MVVFLWWYQVNLIFNVPWSPVLLPSHLKMQSPPSVLTNWLWETPSLVRYDMNSEVLSDLSYGCTHSTLLVPSCRRGGSQTMYSPDPTMRSKVLRASCFPWWSDLKCSSLCAFSQSCKVEMAACTLFQAVCRGSHLAIGGSHGKTQPWGKMRSAIFWEFLWASWESGLKLKHPS